MQQHTRDQYPQTSLGCWHAQLAPPTEWLQKDLLSSAPPERDLQTSASSTRPDSATVEESPGSWRRGGQRRWMWTPEHYLQRGGFCSLFTLFFTCMGCWAGWAPAELLACETIYGWEQSADCQTDLAPPGSTEGQMLMDGSQRVCCLEGSKKYI